MRRLAFLIALLVLPAAASHAQVRYRFELYGSANVPLDKDFEIGPPQSLVSLPGEEQFSPGFRGGIRIGADGFGHWGEDFSYSYGRNAGRIVFPGSDFPLISRSHQFAYNVLFYPGGLKRRAVYPYLTAGAGGTIFTVSDEVKTRALLSGLGELDSHTSFTFNAGGGIRFQFDDNYGLRLDARDWMSHPPRWGIPKDSEDPLAPVLPARGIFHQFEFSMAFVYRY